MHFLKLRSDSMVVCLSILNTWGGHPSQMWQPGKSTVLAVLVSVQAMILGAPFPLLNEPGLGSLGEAPEVIHHRNHIQLKTVKYAMIGWLLKRKSPKARIDVWDDVVETYWKYHGQAALSTVEMWSVQNPAIKVFTKTSLHTNMWVNPAAKQQQLPSTSEDLLKKLQDLLQPLLHKTKPSSKTGSLKVSDTTDRDSSDDALNTDNYATGDTSISTSTSTDSLQPKKKNSTKGKRKEPTNSSPDSSKEFTKRGSKRRKTAADEDEAVESDSEDIMQEIVPDEKPEHDLNSSKENASSGRWVYTGGKSLKEVRAVCHAFDLTPARSINDSISRIEDHVNGEGRMSDELALTHGEIVKSMN